MVQMSSDAFKDLEELPVPTFGIIPGSLFVCKGLSWYQFTPEHRNRTRTRILADRVTSEQG